MIIWNVNPLTENDHLGDWKPEKDCCLLLTLRQSVRNSSPVFFRNKDWSARVASQEKKLPTTNYGNYTCPVGPYCVAHKRLTKERIEILTSDWPIFWLRVIPGLYKGPSL